MRRWLSAVLVASLGAGILVFVLAVLRWAGWPAWLQAAGVTSPAPRDGSGGNLAGKGQSNLSLTRSTAPTTTVPRPPASAGRIHFVELDSAAVGIRFHQVSGNSPEKMYPAANG